ncbi:hypothetical protein IMX26_15665 [Clostridium sp. 'deep sea']|uniref:hypothetical protein n=1 Tax=Clostridium sp. 'deep sea' TaxID=2779445 RepID=UPI0018967A41|nr:hypothetical protein [Clostridium sp. 'deep sea']QOR34878.1 hypothetical protein IMX26_15665 [Clostridium sp. 'deep sea']
MNEKKLSSIIDARLASITVNKDLMSDIKHKSKSHNTKAKPALKVAAIICICVLVFVPVMANKIPAFNRLLSVVSVPLAQMLKPVELVAVNNGIKMEIIAALSDDETTIAYLNLTDLTDKNRVDNTTDLYNFYFTGYSSFCQELVDYNYKTQTATIQLIANGKDLSSKKITFALESFLSAKENFKSVITEIKLNEVIDNEVKTINLDDDSCSGGSGFLISELHEKDSISILKPNNLTTEIPNIDFANISNIGYINERLHVQVKWNKNIDNHGTFYLQDKNNNKKYGSSLYFDINETGKPQYGKKYQEYVFNINKSELTKYQLVADLVKNNHYTEGKWQTTFQIEPSKHTKVINNIKLANMNINKLSISAIGLNITTEQKNAEDLNIKITMNNGEIVSYSSSVTIEDKLTNKKYLFKMPININNIKELSINNKMISLN